MSEELDCEPRIHNLRIKNVLGEENYTNNDHVENVECTVRLLNPNLLVGEKVRGHILSNSLHFALGILFGQDLVELLHQFARFVDRMDFRDMRSKGL